MLARCESKLGFERQYDIVGCKRGPATRDKRSTEKGEGGYRVRNPIQEQQPRPRSAGGNWGAPIPG